MLFLQIDNMWINAEHITSIHQYYEGLEIHFGEKEDDGIMTLRNPAEIDAFLNWLVD